MKIFNQADFVAALARNETDFSGARFDGPIEVNYRSFQKEHGWQQCTELDFSEANLGPSFFLGDVQAETISFEQAHSSGIVALYRLQVQTIQARLLNAQKWFCLGNSRMTDVNLCRSTFPGGFAIKTTPLRTLILDHCESKYSLFDEDNVEHLTSIDAQLGRREPVPLGEFSSLVP